MTNHDGLPAVAAAVVAATGAINHAAIKELEAPATGVVAVTVVATVVEGSTGTAGGGAPAKGRAATVSASGANGSAGKAGGSTPDQPADRIS